MPPETRKLITFANYSNPSSSFVLISMFRYIPESFLVSYHQKTILNSSKLLHNMVLDRLGSNVRQRVHCLGATYVQCVLFKNDAISTADLWAKNDISYGGHFCKMKIL